MEEAQARGHELFYYNPNGLSYQNLLVMADGWPITVKRVQGDHFSLKEKSRINLNDFEVVWLRQDPPFDMGFITTTHLLDRVNSDTLVVNNPTWVRNWPEKLKVLDYPELTPPTTIAWDLDILKSFKKEHEDIILKPLYGNGGAGVFRLSAEDSNISSLHELFKMHNNEPLIAQKFLPDVSMGDKRVILVDGKPVGAINRVPPKGETRSNMHVGGRPEKTNLTERDLEICKRIGEDLSYHGQIFVGIDIIGGYLTEINVTSPTGIQELERFDSVNVAELIWISIEEKIHSKKS
jgi:glutathione synthase